MTRTSCLFLFVLALSGCGVITPQRGSPTAQNRSKNPGKQLAIGPTISRDPVLADPSTMIPPPPNMNFPDIPASPGREDLLASAPGKTQPIASVAANVRPGTELVRAVAEDPESNIDAVRRLHRTAVERFNKLPGYEAKLTRRETVGTKAMPEEVLQMRFRKDPYSLHVRWTGLEGQGREMIYVEGKYDGKVQILTGKNEGLLIRSGQRWSFAPTDSQVRSKSRFDIREGGMGMSIDWFGRVLAIMEADPTQANRLRAVGPKPRLERAAGLEAVEEMIPPDWEPLLPKGGRRTTYFDTDPASPSFGLPILVITLGDTGRQVEYYWFDEFRPIQPADADFDADRMWKK